MAIAMICPFRRKITDFIQANLDNADEKLSVHFLCRRFNLSEASLLRKFKETVGQTPGHYIRQQRLDRASQLLLDPAIPIADIAGRTGYESLHAFYKAFKKATGLAPGEYRIRMALPKRGAGS